MLLWEYYFIFILEVELGLIVIIVSFYIYFCFCYYSFLIFYIMLLVLISFDIIGIGVDEGILLWVIDMLVGILIVWFVVFFIFFDWKYINFKQNLKLIVLVSSNYLCYIIVQLQFGYNEQLLYCIVCCEVYNYIFVLSFVVLNLDSELKKY